MALRHKAADSQFICIVAKVRGQFEACVKQISFHFTPAQLITGVSRFHSLGIHEYQNLCKVFLLKHPIAVERFQSGPKPGCVTTNGNTNIKRCAGKQFRPSDPVKANTSQLSAAKLKIGLLFC